jgi:hypothetical protein
MTTSSRLLMTLSAAVAAGFGVAGSFLPQEILHYADATTDRFMVAVIQIAGALYIGAALLNWSARGALLGGIYGRPIVLANFAHFAIGAIVLVKLLLGGEHAAALVVVTAIYSALAAWFGAVLFGPGPAKA